MADLDRIVRLKTVLARIGLRRSILGRKIGEGGFPRQVALSLRGAGWRGSAINRWAADPAGFRAEPQT